jgi:hypothetical protein
MTKGNGMRFRAILVGVAAAGLLQPATAGADGLPANCAQQYWLYGGLFGRGTTRTICDGPIQADGSWQRGREFYDGRRYIPMRCNWGSYGGSCNGGYWLEEFSEIDYYTVTAETVLPDEPGHLP